MNELVARSISRSVWERLHETGPVSKTGPVWNLRVLATFERSCHLETPASDVVAVVLPDLGDGPLNVVVDAELGVFEAIEAGSGASFDGRMLRLGALRVVLEQAAIWEPRPDWDGLRASRGTIVQRLPQLQTLALASAASASLLDLFVPPSHSSGLDPVFRATLAAARKGAVALREGWAGEPAQLRAAASRLAGLGGGLTPAGDDFITGAMLWAWLVHPAPERWCEMLLSEVAPRTATLSAAFIRAASGGECSAAWHRLLDALQGGPEGQFSGAVRDVLSHGHTSGADALAGFLWMGKI